MNRPQKIKIDIIKIPFVVGLLHIIVILLSQLLTIKHQIGRLSPADTEPHCSLTITFFETFSMCMYGYVRGVH